VILKNSQHVDAAWQWILFLLDHPEAAGSMLPPRPSQYRGDAYAARAGKDVAAVARQLPRELYVWDARLNDPVLGGTAVAFLAAVEAVFQGQADAETALANAQAQAEALFSQQR
jgi:ABC-type glycerol-3-phosphate transport system substrate-binding protein